MKTMIVLWIAFVNLMGCSEPDSQRESRHALDCAYAYLQLSEINSCYADDVCRRGYDVINKLASDEVHARAVIDSLRCPPPKAIEWKR